MAAERRGAAVIGHPVAHSRSPRMQTAGFRAAGLDWPYTAIDVPRDGLDAFLAGLGDSGLAGVNVTIPHKRAVIAACDTLSAEAEAAGSVNTIVVNTEGRLLGHSTDGRGLLWALGERSPADALVLGAGGAARAVVAALGEAGWSVRVSARRPDAAAALGTAVEPWPPARLASLVVNATPLGQAGDPGSLPLDPGLLRPGMLVCDLAYRGDGEPTALGREAAGRGADVVDGLEVLLGQGIFAFRLLTGLEAPVEAMRRAVRAQAPT
jgi:shikimate dehydrogenase